MTLLVALKGTDGLVLAADSRGTFGDPQGVTAQNDSQQKAHTLAPRVGVLQAGASEVGALIIQNASEEVEASSLDGVTPVMEQLRKTARGSFDEWFPSVPAIPPPQLAAMGQVAARPLVAFIVAGYESDGKDPKLYQLVSGQDFAPMLHDYGFAVSGVAQYALYLLNRLYEPDRSIQDLQSLAVYVITETASQDGKVGGPVQVVTVKPKKGCEVMEAAAVSKIVAANESRSNTLRESFYEEGK